MISKLDFKSTFQIVSLCLSQHLTLLCSLILDSGPTTWILWLFSTCHPLSPPPSPASIYFYLPSFSSFFKLPSWGSSERFPKLGSNKGIYRFLKLHMYFNSQLLKYFKTMRKDIFYNIPNFVPQC